MISLFLLLNFTCKNNHHKGIFANLSFYAHHYHKITNSLNATPNNPAFICKVA